MQVFYRHNTAIFQFSTKAAIFIQEFTAFAAEKCADLSFGPPARPFAQAQKSGESAYASMQLIELLAKSAENGGKYLYIN